jgi:hypothetical protein
MRAIEYKRSFDKSYLKLDREDKILAALAIEKFLNGIEAKKMPAGLGLKRLRGDLWEIRADIRIRIALRMSHDRIEFGLVGTHESIKNYLKNL